VAPKPLATLALPVTHIPIAALALPVTH